LGQISVAPFISLATLFCVMMFPINLNDQVQRHAAKVSRVWPNGILAAKFLVPASSITDDLPYGLRKLVGLSPLISRERDCIRVAPRSSC
jgi:hypothetical protein